MVKKADDAFPRGTDLPAQSPLFWVQQKDRYLRQLLIRDIEDHTKRRLVVYFANRFVENSDIDNGDIAQLQEALEDVAGNPCDLMLTTNGGATDATEAIVSLLQALVPDLRVVVPHSAKSNGTMICLAAKSIVMGPPSELGPIDPSIAGTPTSILATPRVEAENYALHKLAIYAIQQSRKLATNLLSEGMMRGKTPEEINNTVGKLASRDHFHSHGSVIDHKEASKLGLSVEYLASNDPSWQRFWLLYTMYAHDVMQSSALKIFEGRARSATVVP